MVQQEDGEERIKFNTAGIICLCSGMAHRNKARRKRTYLE